MDLMLKYITHFIVTLSLYSFYSALVSYFLTWLGGREGGDPDPIPKLAGMGDWLTKDLASVQPRLIKMIGVTFILLAMFSSSDNET